MAEAAMVFLSLPALKTFHPAQTWDADILAVLVGPQDHRRPGRIIVLVSVG